MSARAPSLIAFLLASACAFGALRGWENHHDPDGSGFLSVPPSGVLSAGASGYENLLADLLYMRFVTYWGHQLTHGRNFHNLAPLLNAIVDLDPRFLSAYEIGALALGDAGQADEAAKLLSKGWRRDPQNWWYPYQAGLMLFLHGEDYLRAADYFERAADLPGAPREAAFFAARMYERGARRELAARTWRAIHRANDDPSIKEIAKRALARLGERLPETEERSKIE